MSYIFWTVRANMTSCRRESW